MGKKGNPRRVHPFLAKEAWKRAGGDRKRTYSEYIRLFYQMTGKLAPGCDNADLQAWLDVNVKEE